MAYTVLLGQFVNVVPRQLTMLAYTPQYGVYSVAWAVCKCCPEAVNNVSQAPLNIHLLRELTYITYVYSDSFL